MDFSKAFLLQLAAAIARTPSKASTKFVAIDGRSGSGKSSLAKALQDLRPDYQIVSLDDFPCRESEHPFHPLGTQTEISWQRLLNDVMKPLSEGRDSTYKRTPWWRSESTEPESEVKVYSGKITLLEGLTSMRKELQPYLDFMIWIECPVGVASMRAMQRDGGYEKNLKFWEEIYTPNEDQYIAGHNPKEAADFIVF